MSDAATPSTRPAPARIRNDLRVVAELVAPGARLLDIGCGDGDLLAYLAAEKGVDGRGIELSQAGVNACVARGLSVIQGDADRDLAYYPDRGFDYAVLSQTIQATMAPKTVLQELLRIGDKAIVSFPNFGYWDVRLRLMFGGRMPVSERLPYSWYDTPNIHFCTIRDFVALCREIGATVEKAVALDGNGNRVPFNAPWWVWNLIGAQAVFLLKRR
ncbi:methionine biosynthesis protein MetW [Methylobrevis albus]|uniref:Methionine biosynthesis protein MetW n=1 Tax=Methylobrevis albus TaxID=2793297 RepID=A0A931MZG6_9HYPH|nr:methionine biosynthesis protein MetW [Methylobrevis albus]MBH0238044.1 methionine biosynthesis protein MetW [Methylobrevis albus]